MARIFNTRLLVAAFFGFILALFLFLRLNATETEITEKNARTSYFYELDENGNIGTLLDQNEADCNEPAGEYCTVELSAPRPSGMNTVQQAEASSIHLNTYYKE